MPWSWTGHSWWEDGHSKRSRCSWDDSHWTSYDHSTYSGWWSKSSRSDWTSDAWYSSSQPTSISKADAGTPRDLEVMTRAEFDSRVRAGAPWFIVDGTVIDIEALKDVHKGGLDVLQSRIGLDITGMFRCFHSNLPRIQSLHSPGVTVMEHIREKVAANAVGVLDTYVGWPPLSSPSHRFWVESKEKAPYMEVVPDSLAMEGEDVLRILSCEIDGLSPGSARYRAFWAVVGCLVSDAAAQPTQWNYKLPYFQEELRQRDRWDDPEFMRPSLNAWYKVPLGAHSAYGDMTVEVLRSLVAQHELDPMDIEQRYVSRFGEDGDYGPLSGRPGELPVLGAYRHNSLRSFIEKVQDGYHWPHCGTRNAMEFPVRIIPVVAVYAGRPEMLEKVRDVVRVVQDHPAPVAVGEAYARILEAVIMSGSDGAEAISLAVDSLERLQAEAGSGMDAKVLEAITDAMERSHLPLYEATISLGDGRFCTSRVA